MLVGLLHADWLDDRGWRDAETYPEAQMKRWLADDANQLLVIAVGILGLFLLVMIAGSLKP